MNAKQQYKATFRLTRCYHRDCRAQRHDLARLASKYNRLARRQGITAQVGRAADASYLNRLRIDWLSFSPSIRRFFRRA